MDKSILNLDENEYVVYQNDDSCVLFNEEELELIITNLNIILIAENTHMFKKSTYDIVNLPIANIKVIDHIPQIVIELGEYSSWNIVILFNNGVKKIGIYYDSIFKKKAVKKDAELLAEKISQLCLKGTIVLKQNTGVNEERNEPVVERKSDILKKTFLGEKITGGINSIKEAVKPQAEKKEVVQVSSNDSSLVVQPLSTKESLDFKNNRSFEKKHSKAMKQIEDFKNRHKTTDEDRAILLKNGFVDYEIVEAPDILFYVDYSLKKFATKDFLTLKIYKFKDFKEYKVHRGNLKSSSKMHFDSPIDGALNGALSGWSLGTTFATKSVAKVAAKAGALVGGLSRVSGLSIGSRVKVRIEVYIVSCNISIELPEESSFEDYRPWLEMFDKISEINRKKKR